MTKNWIAPSILSANFAALGEDVQAVCNHGVDLIHIDVMDNHYVPNLTFGPLVCSALKDFGISVPFDVHLMCKPVDALITQFAKAGASYISFHPEASDHIDRSIQLIQSLGVKAGLALNPATPIEYLDYTIDSLDMVLLMSVNPGFSGQSFIPSVLEKIKHVRHLIDTRSPHTRLEIDGGVKLSNIETIKEAGVDTFVMGSAIFDTSDYEKTIHAFRQAIC